jgi:hydroxymethylbilane synthase
MPAEIPDGLCIGAIPERENPSDVFISRSGLGFDEIDSGSIIGTSSLRRGAQLRHARPDMVIQPLRGNLDTRLKKLETENLDAIVLAAAGVKRLNLEHKITEYLDPDIVLPIMRPPGLSSKENVLFSTGSRAAARSRSPGTVKSAKIALS